MDLVGVMAAYLPVVRVCTALFGVPLYSVILAKHCIELPDDGSFVIRNMLEQSLSLHRAFGRDI